MTPTDRYKQDAHFRMLVDLLESFIHKAQFTPTELREASLLAAIHYEYKKVRPLYRANPDGSVTVWDRAIREQP